MIEKEFTPEVVETILGGPNRPGSGQPHWQRTPLHVDFQEGSHGETSESAFPKATTTVHTDFAEDFNAIGSRVKDSANAVHLPVLDLDGGAETQAVKGSKVMIGKSPAKRVSYQIGLSRYSFKPEAKSYGPRSLLRDVLGDNGIDLEVFEFPVTEYSRMTAQTSIVGTQVTAIVLRATESGIFEVAQSTQEGHSHLYIQAPFSDDDHRTLISELGSIGMISPHWEEITEAHGMGIVRSPWTKKAVTHQPS